MPCMYNGQPVKGVKGACPMNSTWVEDTPPAPVDARNFGEKAFDYVKENPLEAASYGAMAIPLGGPLVAGGLRGASALYKGMKMRGKMGSLMDRFFRKDVMKPKIVPPPANFVGAPNPFIPAVLEKGRALSPLKIGGTASTLAGAGGLYASGADDRAANASLLQKQEAEKASAAMDANTQALMDANAAEAEKKRVAGLNPMERIMENLKKPGFLTDPIMEGGPPGYNRLSKLATLMTYYGSTPKQREKLTEPSKQFAAIEKGIMDNKTALAKAQATLSSPFGKPSVKNLADSLMNKVKSEFGDTWLTFGAEKDQLPAIANAVAIRITQLTQQYPGADPAQIEAEAFKQIEEEGWKNVA